jgi:hypothetical protein
MEVKFSGRENYRGSLHVKRNECQQVVRWHSVEPLIIRRRVEAAAPQGAAHQIFVPLLGRLGKRQDGREAQCSPGQLTIIDQSRPYGFSQPGTLAAVMLTVPTPRLLAVLGREPRTAVPIDAASGLGRIFLGMLRDVASDRELDGPSFDIACGHLLNLLAVVVADRARTRQTRPCATRTVGPSSVTCATTWPIRS